MVNMLFLSLMIVSVLSGFLYIISNKRKKDIELLKTENSILKNEKSELEKKKIVSDVKIKKLSLDNSYLTLTIIETSKMVKKMMSINPKNTMGEFDDDFRNPIIFDEKIKNKYNVDDILTEIGEVGIGNISKEKLEFLNKNK